MAAEPERVLGVLTSVREGFTDYDLVFTNRRVIGVKVGSSALAQLLPGVSGLVGVTVARGRHEAHREAFQDQSLDELLGAHRKNFAIEYGTVERGTFDGGVSMSSMPMLYLWVAGRRRRFAFLKSIWRKDKVQVAQAHELLTTTLGPRMEFKRV